MKGVQLLLLLLLAVLLPAGMQRRGAWAKASLSTSTEAAALQAFRAALTRSQALSSWGAEAGLCSSWAGVRCSPGGQVTKLLLGKQGLQGPISWPSLARLSALAELNLEGNVLSGSLPSALPPALTLLRLGGNRLKGSVPRGLRLPAVLRELHLASNALTGDLPPLDLGPLEVLNLAGNQLTSIPANLGSSSILHTLNLSSNRLRALPPGLQLPRKLESLDLAGNQLQGTLLQGQALPPTLTVLSLGSNSLAGTLDALLPLPRRLEVLLLENNTLAGSPGALLAGLPSSLRALSLGHNLLQGELPQGLQLPPGLLSLGLNDNQLQGGIPGDWRLANGARVDLRRNNLTGTLPAYPGLNEIEMEVLPQSGPGFCGKVPASPKYLSHDEGADGLDTRTQLLPKSLPFCSPEGDSVPPSTSSGSSSRGSRGSNVAATVAAALSGTVALAGIALLSAYWLLRLQQWGRRAQSSSPAGSPFSPSSCPVALGDFASGRQLLELPSRPPPGPHWEPLQRSSRGSSRGSRGSPSGGPAPNPFWEPPQRTQSELELVDELKQRQLEREGLAGSRSWQLLVQTSRGLVNPEGGLPNPEVVSSPEGSVGQVGGSLLRSRGGSATTSSQLGAGSPGPSRQLSAPTLIIGSHLSRHASGAAQPAISKGGSMAGGVAAGMAGSTSPAVAALEATPAAATAAAATAAALRLGNISPTGSSSSSGDDQAPLLPSSLVFDPATPEESDSGAMGAAPAVDEAGDAAEALLPTAIDPERPGDLGDGGGRTRIDPRSITLQTHPDGVLVELGQGAFGKVYLGLHNERTPVAVKLLNRDGLRSPTSLQREVAVTEACRGPNIVQFFGTCVIEEEWLVLVTEYLAGGDLARSIRLPDFRWHNRGWQVALDIARGLHWLHSRSLVHLDIKTSNVLLTADGRAKIADFGLSHFLSDRDYLSDSVVQMGTFPYAAPEVLLASKVTTKADCYSLGVLLWELITGEVPKRGCLRPLQPPRECPQAVAELVDACLLAEPQHRPTALEALEVLLAAVQEQAPDGAQLSPRGGSAPEGARLSSPALTEGHR